MKRIATLVFILATSLMSCKDSEPKNTEYKGIIIEGNPCTGPRSIVIKIFSKEINSRHITSSGEVENTLVGYMDGMDMLATDTTIQFGNESIDLRDTLNFSFEEGPIPPVLCAALYSIPRLQGRITKISN